MAELITVVRAADVTEDYKKEAEAWTKWDSKVLLRLCLSHSSHILLQQETEEVPLQLHGGRARSDFGWQCHLDSRGRRADQDWRG
jgi:hypothetical protein